MAIIPSEGEGLEDDHGRFHSLLFDPNSGTGQIAMVTFHQNFAYEDFVEGIRPTLAENMPLDGNDAPRESGALAYELRDGIFKQIADAASKSPTKNYVLIIDEINRGNIAKIFGELITLIEDSRRHGKEDATSVILPYSKTSFTVPDNLYIIGTMNTADRSIQLLDTALRRRFAFIEMMPEPHHRLVSQDVDGVDCKKMLKCMNDRIRALLDREHQIGHTYLFGIDTMDALSDTFRNRIFPLLQEYFFDDWGKIRTVLRGNSFVQDEGIDPYVKKSGMVDTDHKDYQRLPDTDPKWLSSAEYQKIYDDKETRAEEAS